MRQDQVGETDLTTGIIEILRPLPWPSRAAYIDHLISCGFDGLLRGDPDIRARSSVGLLWAHFRPILAGIGGDQISDLDEALVLAFLSPDRFDEVTEWLATNQPSAEVLGSWRSRHQGFATLAQILDTLNPVAPAGETFH